MMELWPFTNFHDLNLDWIIKMIKVYTKKVDDLYDYGLYDYVEKVLTAHPEWTTTVMDGAINTAKLMDGAVSRPKLSEDLRKFMIGDTDDVTAAPRGMDQDAAIYNNTMFAFDGVGNYRVYNMPDGAVLYDGTLPGSDVPHANAVSFGLKQNPSDAFPLLYVTGYNGTLPGNVTMPYGTCYVYYINNDYSMTLVQTISVDNPTSEPYYGDNSIPLTDGCIPWGNFVADPERNSLVIFNDYAKNTKGETRIYTVALPNMGINNVTIDLSNEAYITLPMVRYPQGACIDGNTLYIAAGIQSNVEATAYIIAYNLEHKAITKLYPVGQINEPEVVCIYDDTIMYGEHTLYYMNGDASSPAGMVDGYVGEGVGAYSLIGEINADLASRLYDAEQGHRDNGLVYAYLAITSNASTLAQMLENNASNILDAFKARKEGACYGMMLINDSTLGLVALNGVYNTNANHFEFIASPYSSGQSTVLRHVYDQGSSVNKALALNYLNNKTITYGGSVSLSGFNATDKIVNLTIPLPGRLMTGSNVTLTACTILMRNHNGLMDGKTGNYDYFNDSSYTISLAPVGTGDALRLQIIASSTIANAESGTPVTASIGSLSFNID